jgi:hypothetical protein
MRQRAILHGGRRSRAKKRGGRGSSRLRGHAGALLLLLRHGQQVRQLRRGRVSWELAASCSAAQAHREQCSHVHRTARLRAARLRVRRQRRGDSGGQVALHAQQCSCQRAVQERHKSVARRARACSESGQPAGTGGGAGGSTTQPGCCCGCCGACCSCCWQGGGSASCGAAAVSAAAVPLCSSRRSAVFSTSS